MNADPDPQHACDAVARYRAAVDHLGGAIARLAAGYEADPAEREDLVQEIHLQLWRSLRLFDGRCSLRTWVLRVAHNVAADHVARARRRPGLVDLDRLDDDSLDVGGATPEQEAGARQALGRLLDLVHRLKPIDRQLMLLHLEGEDAAGIAAVTGLSTGAVATRLHRVRALLARRLNDGRPR